jgi:hypothetical protein
MIDEIMLKSICEKMIKACEIDPKLFTLHNVKRGLRNPDHTGVLVGLTNIADVIGYEIEDGTPCPIEGELLYRGYKLDQLVEGFQKEGRHGFEEICYLLLVGELPNSTELQYFSKYFAERRDLPENFTKNTILTLISQDMMNMLARAVLVLYTMDPNPEDRREENIIRQSLNLIAKFPTIVAYSYNMYRHEFQRKTLSIRHPRPELSMAENFLHVKGRSLFQAGSGLARSGAGYARRTRRRQQFNLHPASDQLRRDGYLFRNCRSHRFTEGTLSRRGKSQGDADDGGHQGECSQLEGQGCSGGLPIEAFEKRSRRQDRENLWRRTCRLYPFRSASYFTKKKGG